MRIGISTGGGDAPGLNAVIRAAVVAALGRGWEVFGVRPGAVTPFGLINDRAQQRVRVALDLQMLEHDPLNFHPLHNEATTAISAADFRRFFGLIGHETLIVDFDALEELERARTAAA